MSSLWSFLVFLSYFSWIRGVFGLAKYVDYDDDYVDDDDWDYKRFVLFALLMTVSLVVMLKAIIELMRQMRSRGMVSWTCQK